MKKLITIVLLTFFFASSAYADRWCQWSGTQGIECKNDRDGVLNLPFPTRTEALINTKGYFRVTITQPTIGANQVRDAEVWGFADNQISLTWSVRDLTAAEIQARTAGAMSLSQYYIWKTLLATGVITQQQAANHLPQKLIDAYQARDAIENP